MDQLPRFDRRAQHSAFDCTDGYGIAALYDLELVNP
jgi:hypothetical protein